MNQNGFSEWGSANSLDLNVAQQTTNSLRSTFGAELAGAIGLGDTRTLDLALRLGWLHEFADTGRPITAAFAGAPSNAFTVYGATPQRDAAVIGFSGQHRHRRGDLDLPPLRRRDRQRHRQPHPQCRRAPHLVRRRGAGMRRTDDPHRERGPPQVGDPH